MFGKHEELFGSSKKKMASRENGCAYACDGPQDMVENDAGSKRPSCCGRNNRVQKGLNLLIANCSSIMQINWQVWIGVCVCVY